MKIILAVLVLAMPIASQADRLIYPEGSVKLSHKSGNSLKHISDSLGLGLNPSEFQLIETKESLLGKHMYYKQMVNGVVVEEAEVVVSLDSSDQVMKVYNNVVSGNKKTVESAVPLISQSQALELAWNHLQVNGELIEAPIARLVYSKSLNLEYRINLSVSSPAGHFDLTVDAQTGKILSSVDAALPRMKRASLPARNKSAAKFKSFTSALKDLEAKNFAKSVQFLGIKVNGSAQVFDPNPVVTLGRYDLQDTTPLSAFTQAYRNEDLIDITFANGVYSLRGPNVTLIDFESPKVAPSTSVDGSWIFERKDPRFNDAMTYLHLDRSMRYIESLGFTGSKAVFTKALEVDANGVNGDDNSHYIPSSRRLAFGSGCVDDNEDAEVILHELGHAIHSHINSNWRGGDTGAMGEGFGDYWAASYSYTTEGGNVGNTDWAFKWDGHNDCWPGRKLNTYTPYSASTTYVAHGANNAHDELWSTPIFQAFKELFNSGVSREDIDKIILEAHFGLGSGVKIPDMAKSIVRTAKALFPNKDYDQVYERHFKKMKML